MTWLTTNQASPKYRFRRLLTAAPTCSVRKNVMHTKCHLFQVCTVWMWAITLHIGRILLRQLTHYWRVFEGFWAQGQQDDQIRRHPWGTVGNVAVLTAETIYHNVRIQVVKGQEGDKSLKGMPWGPEGQNRF
jgi:hypothetical protein